MPNGGYSGWSGRRSVAGPRGSRPRGVCPVCRTEQQVSQRTGYMSKHATSAAAPTGCAGKGQRPMSVRELRQSTEVTELHPPVAHDQAPIPDVGVEVLVERRDEQPPVSLRPPPDGAA